MLFNMLTPLISTMIELGGVCLVTTSMLFVVLKTTKKCVCGFSFLFL